MAYDTVRFTFADPYLSKLKENVKQGESMHQAAKRLLAALLIPSDETPADPSELEDIKQRLSLLEKSFQDFLQGFNEVEDTLNHIQPQIDFTKTRITKLENELKQTPAPGRSRSKGKPVQDEPDYSVTPF